VVCLKNNKGMFSDEYNRMIKKMDRITKNMSPGFVELCQNISKLDSVLKINISLDQLSASKRVENQIQDFTQISKQLTGILPSIQLSKEMQEYIQEAKKSEKLTEEEFEKKYFEEFEICQSLGAKGWVVSRYSNPRHIKNWYKALIEDEPEKITQFFEKDNGCVIKSAINMLESKYDDPVNRNYYSRGIKAFQDNDYMTCAMYLVGLLEARVNALVQFRPKTRYREKFSDKGFADVKQKQFSKSEFFFAKRFYFLNVYPSLIAFLNRLFVDGEYIFDKGVEPPYINRNWLLHGKCGREIERFECIQLINALETVEYVLGEKEKEGALDDEQDGENEN
jgi:hypothetical protein